MATTTELRPPPEGGGSETQQPMRAADAPLRSRSQGSAAPPANRLLPASAPRPTKVVQVKRRAPPSRASRAVELDAPSTEVNRAPAAPPPSRRFLLGLLGLLVVYVTMSLALSAVAPAVGLGWTSVVITSGSMSPSIRIGDVVMASPHDGRGLGAGTVVVFSDPARPGLLTHRIESVNPDGSYVTSGDANRLPDSTPLRPEQVVGVGRLLVPYIGLPLVWYWAGAWGELAVWVAGMLLALWLARYALLDKYHPRAQLEDGGHLATSATAPDRMPESRVKILPSVSKPVPRPVVDVTTSNGSDPERPITRDDVSATSEPVSAPRSETTATSPKEVPARDASEEVEAEGAAPSSQAGVGDRRPPSPLRRPIAANMATSRAEIPRMTTFDEVDASRLLEVRQELGRGHDTKIPLAALVVMAVIPALESFPEFNATLDGDELIVHGLSDVGVAMDTSDGLSVTVIRDAATKGVIELAGEVRRLGEGAKSRSLSPDELTGQTFTVSFVGALAGGHGTPIIPPGTTAILSAGRAQQKPLVADDELAIAPVMLLSLSYDHRVIDEGLGRRFMAQVIENLEKPALFLAT